MLPCWLCLQGMYRKAFDGLLGAGLQFDYVLVDEAGEVRAPHWGALHTQPLSAVCFAHSCACTRLSRFSQQWAQGACS